MHPQDLKFFNPWEVVEVSENHLPHWEQPGATYYVTWRTADSLPKTFLQQYRQEKETWLSQHPKPWLPVEEAEYNQKFLAQFEKKLDAGHGQCLLRQPNLSKIVAETLMHFEGDRTQMVSYVIMPNHVHALFTMHPKWELTKVVQTWKSHSGKLINQATGQTGTFWQKDYFDRIVRDFKHFGKCVRYIRNNPAKAKLRDGEFLLYENDLAKRV